MLVQQLGFKGIAASTAPAAIQPGEGLQSHALDDASAGALPMALLSLLYPDEIEPADLFRLGGGSLDSAWRVVLVSDGRPVRISRRSTPDSVVVEVAGDAAGAWKIVARGTADARKRIDTLLRPPPRPLLESVVFATNPVARKAGASTGALPDEPSRVTLVTSEDLIGEMAAGVEAGDVDISADERRALGPRFARARSREMIEDTIRAIDDAQKQIIGRMSGMVNDNGEMARVHREIAELPPTRALAAHEREVLEDPAAREADLRRRIDESEREAGRLRRGRGGTQLVWASLAAGGVAATVALTLFSIFGPPGSHRFAMGNLVVLGVALFGALRWIADEESKGRQGRKLDVVRRRLEQVELDLEHHLATLRDLRREFDVSNLAEYEERAGRREALEARLKELRSRHSVQASAPEYRTLEERSEILGAQTRLCRRVLEELGEDEGYSALMETRLRAGGWLPGLVLWNPAVERDGMRARLADLLTALAGAGLHGPAGLDAAVKEGWRKIAARIFGSPLDALDLLPTGAISIDGIHDAFDTDGEERCWLLLEGLRLALITSLSRSDAWQWPWFIFRVRALELDDHELAVGLRRVYETLGRKMQVISVDVR